MLLVFQIKPQVKQRVNLQIATANKIVYQIQSLLHGRPRSMWGITYPIAQCRFYSSSQRMGMVVS
ncbi:MAG: hypothetical protein CMM01_16610 [Rhodopirellula sp.]|nr:hypothetical protein [Rhodopirellula sp.]MAI72510.1 hypothetical protein [Rhodopirellula sp.]